MSATKFHNHTYENIYRPENIEAVGSAAEVTSVLPTAGQKFPLHFEGCLGFLLNQICCVLIARLLGDRLTMFHGPLVGKYWRRWSELATAITKAIYNNEHANLA
jgi:hypothetical protein